MSFEKMIQSLDGITRAKAPENFESAVLAKVKKSSLVWIKWMKVSVAAMLIMGVINILVITQLQQEGSENVLDDVYVHQEDIYDTNYFVIE